MGDDSGVAETAEEFDLRHVGLIERNEYGTPLVSDIFGRAKEAASCNLMCYVNADIILLSDFMEALERVAEIWPAFLSVGQRWDLDVLEPIDFSEGWELVLRSKARTAGRLHGPTGPDYFVFPSGLWKSIPPFGVGRTAWDLWFIYEARRQGVPVVDQTEAITVIHQNHAYAHHPGGVEGVWKGEEARRNLELLGGMRNAYTMRDATHLAVGDSLRRRLIPWDLKRCLLFPITMHPRIRPWINAWRSVKERAHNE